MMKKAIAIIFCFLLFANIAAAAEPQKLKIIKPETEKTFDAAKPIISLITAKQNSNAFDNQSMTVSPEIHNNTFVNSSEPATKTESIDSPDVLSGSVAKGNALFARSLMDGMYADFETSNITKEYGSMRGAIATVLTFVPNPYDDPIIQDLYTDYNNLAIYFVILFILGEFLNRRMAQLKVTTGVFGNKDLSQSRFIGGMCMCMLGLAANLIFMFALDVTASLSQFAVMPSMDAIAPNPGNLLLYIMMGLCDLIVLVFFVIRYFLIYIIAVLCSLIAVMLVPDVTRGFALDAIEKIIRLLIMQPAALFASVIGIYASKGVPAPLESFGYLGLTIVIICVCWYCLFGNFTLLKQAVAYAVRKGVVKV